MRGSFGRHHEIVILLFRMGCVFHLLQFEASGNLRLSGGIGSMRSRHQIRSFSSFWRDEESWSPLVVFESIRSDFVRRGCRVVTGWGFGGGWGQCALFLGVGATKFVY